MCRDLGKHLALKADPLLIFLLVVGESNRLVEETHFWKKYHRLPVCQTNLSLCKDRLTIFFVIMHLEKERKIFCYCWMGLLGTSLSWPWPWGFAVSNWSEICTHQSWPPKKGSMVKMSLKWECCNRWTRWTTRGSSWVLLHCRWRKGRWVGGWRGSRRRRRLSSWESRSCGFLFCLDTLRLHQPITARQKGLQFCANRWLMSAFCKTQISGKHPQNLIIFLLMCSHLPKPLPWTNNCKKYWQRIFPFGTK